jgi:hypothetical protein
VVGLNETKTEVIESKDGITFTWMPNNLEAVLDTVTGLAYNGTYYVASGAGPASKDMNDGAYVAAAWSMDATQWFPVIAFQTPIVGSSIVYASPNFIVTCGNATASKISRWVFSNPFHVTSISSSVDASSIA